MKREARWIIKYHLTCLKVAFSVNEKNKGRKQRHCFLRMLGTQDSLMVNVDMKARMLAANFKTRDRKQLPSKHRK